MRRWSSEALLGQPERYATPGRVGAARPRASGPVSAIGDQRDLSRVNHANLKPGILNSRVVMSIASATFPDKAHP